MNNEENAKVEIYKDTKIKAESKTEKNSIVEEDINIGKDEDEAKNDNKNMALTALRRNNDGGTGWN
ncbi:MAG: hypothetical protein PHR25_01820 [Clostridia bacterium]|nr:hypothetical protein [Clostridia bacterium]MDD4375499.1 hypothetical protein [Clostridia bacterium]